jgi:hypothetical protein
MPLGIRHESGGVQHRPTLVTPLIAVPPGQEEIARKQCRPRALCHQLHRHGKRGIRASGKAHEKAVVAGEVLDNIRVEVRERLC